MCLTNSMLIYYKVAVLHPQTHIVITAVTSREAFIPCLRLTLNLHFIMLSSHIHLISKTAKIYFHLPEASQKQVLPAIPFQFDQPIPFGCVR